MALFAPERGVKIKHGTLKDVRAPNKRYARIMKINHSQINKDTNLDALSRAEFLKEASVSKNQARVRLLNEIHLRLEEQTHADIDYAYDPINDMSFTGEFEAIGA